MCVCDNEPDFTLSANVVCQIRFLFLDFSLNFSRTLFVGGGRYHGFLFLRLSANFKFPADLVQKEGICIFCKIIFSFQYVHMEELGIDSFFSCSDNR